MRNKEEQIITNFGIWEQPVKLQNQNFDLETNFFDILRFI